MTKEYKMIRVDQETYTKLKKLAGEKGQSMVYVISSIVKQYEPSGESIEERMSRLEGQIQGLAYMPAADGTRMWGATPVSQTQTTDDNPDKVEAYRNADDEERRDMLNEQVELVAELKMRKEKVEKPLKDYAHWEVVYGEEKAIADYEGGDATLYEDSLREMQDVLEREGVGTKDELKKKIDDEAAPLREEYEREREILSKMRKNA